MKHVSIHRWAAYGDVIESTVIASKLNALGWSVSFSTLEPICRILERHPHIGKLVPWKPGTDHGADICLDNSYENSPLRKTSSRLSINVGIANAWLSKNGHEQIDDLPMEPVIVPDPMLVRHSMSAMARFRKPWIAICPRSNGYPVRTVSRMTWAKVSGKLPGTIFWTGTDPAPMNAHNVRDLRLNSFPMLVAALACCDLVITVDSGPMLAARALGKPMVIVEQSVFVRNVTSSLTNCEVVTQQLPCIGCSLEKCPVNPAIPPCQFPSQSSIVEAAKRMLAKPKP